jgi:DNA-binding transcriptional ArsR family regulator
MPKQPAPDVNEIMKALAHPVRREILSWLKQPQKAFREQHHPFEMGICAGMIFEKAELSQSTISAHLATLQRAGLVTVRKVGQWVFYRRNDGLIEKFLERMRSDL